jgi:hypothetical protein
MERLARELITNIRKLTALKVLNIDPRWKGLPQTNTSLLQKFVN